MYKTEEIANYLVEETIKANKPITNRKLQVMMYCIQGFYYNQTDKPFIEGSFEAWFYN